MRVDGLDIALLGRRSGRDQALAGVDHQFVADIPVAADRHAHGGVDFLLADRQASLQTRVEIGQRCARGGHRFRYADDRHLVAARVDGYVEKLFDARQVGVMRAEQLDHQVVLTEFDPIRDVARSAADVVESVAHAASSPARLLACPARMRTSAICPSRESVPFTWTGCI